VDQQPAAEAPAEETVPVTVPESPTQEQDETEQVMEQQLTDLDGEEIKPESDSCNCKPLSSIFQCKKEGRFSDKSNCRNYYRCVPDEEGFVADMFECDMGYAFDQTTGGCVPEVESKCKQGKFYSNKACLVQ